MKNVAKSEAVTQRRRGKSIKEIARLVKVSQSTVSRWCADMKLSKVQREKLDEHRRTAGIKALTPWIEQNKALKRRDLKTQFVKGKRDVGALHRRDLFMLGLGLYWGEGYKRGSQECGFTNSEPKIIRTILFWLKEKYDIPVDDIIARLTINERHKDQTRDLLTWWSHETNIPLPQFGKASYIKGYSASKLPVQTYRGTLRIKVRRGTSLRRRILASIDEICRQIDAH